MSVKYPMGVPPDAWKADASSGKALPASSTRYMSVLGQCAISATESRAVMRAPCDGIIHDFKLEVMSGDSVDTYTLRVAGADTSVVLVTSGSSGAETLTDTTTKVSVDEDDLVVWKIVSLAAQGTIYYAEMKFQPR